MISKVERQHILIIKKWSQEMRVGLQELQAGPIGKLLAKVSGEQNPNIVFDNVDWLIALIERESHTANVKGLVRAVEEHETSHVGRS